MSALTTLTVTEARLFLRNPTSVFMALLLPSLLLLLQGFAIPGTMDPIRSDNPALVGLRVIDFFGLLTTGTCTPRKPNRRPTSRNRSVTCSNRAACSPMKSCIPRTGCALAGFDIFTSIFTSSLMARAPSRLRPAAQSPPRSPCCAAPSS